MYLLWKSIFSYFDLTDDVTTYLVSHFYVPFVIAEKEKLKIDDVYHTLYENDALVVLAAMDGSFLSKALSLVRDDSLVFDTRVGDTDRIVKFLTMLRPIKSLPEVPVERAITFLKKGLSIGSMTAFDILDVADDSILLRYYTDLSNYYVEMKSFLYHIAKEIRVSLPLLPKDINPDIVRRLLLVSLEMGIIDTTLETFLASARIFTRDWCLHSSICRTERQRNNLVLFQNKSQEISLSK